MAVGPATPGRITINCLNLVTLIRQSYILFANGAMNLTQVKLVPPDKPAAWIESDLYTIEAKAESTPNQPLPSQGIMLRPMMQALLEDRFQVKVHREVHSIPVYELRVAKEGPHLTAAAEESCLAGVDVTPAPQPGQPFRPLCGVPLIMNNGFQLRGATMDQFALALTVRADRKVIDKTGLTGRFDIRLDWTNGDLAGEPARPPAAPGALPAVRQDPDEVTAGIRTALQKFGLRLDAMQGPGDFLIVDHVEKPAAN